MSTYAFEHADALADLREAGAAVTFSRTSGTYDETTDTTGSIVTLTITGYAMRVSGDPDVYRRLQLTQASAPTLFFAPDTIGQLPLPGDAITWGGFKYTVREVNPFDFDGRGAIAAYVVVAR